jgi:hypothetical protein
MTTISEKVRQFVQERADNRCEYCLSHQNFVMSWLQIDHIYPIVLGGANDEDNLCLACELCNQYKWTKTNGIDPVTGQTVMLFHPRKQKWSEHFTWSESGTEIVGLTVSGRATVEALRFNNELAVTVRGNWVKAGWHPPILTD